MSLKQILEGCQYRIRSWIYIRVELIFMGPNIQQLMINCARALTIKALHLNLQFRHIHEMKTYNRLMLISNLHALPLLKVKIQPRKDHGFKKGIFCVAIHLTRYPRAPRDRAASQPYLCEGSNSATHVHCANNHHCTSLGQWKIRVAWHYMYPVKFHFRLYNSMRIPINVFTITIIQLRFHHNFSGYFAEIIQSHN